jgi:hypothetical protein
MTHERHKVQVLAWSRVARASLERKTICAAVARVFRFTPLTRPDDGARSERVAAAPGDGVVHAVKGEPLRATESLQRA